MSLSFTWLYWILPIFTGFLLVFYPVLLCFLGSWLGFMRWYWVCTEFEWVELGSNGMVAGFTEFYWVFFPVFYCRPPPAVYQIWRGAHIRCEAIFFRWLSMRWRNSVKRPFSFEKGSVLLATETTPTLPWNKKSVREESTNKSMAMICMLAAVICNLDDTLSMSIKS